MGIEREEAEDAIKSLIQIGVIECLTAASFDFTLYDNTHFFRLVSYTLHFTFKFILT